MNEALKWAVEMNDSFEIASNYVALGDFYYKFSKNKESLTYYLKARDILNESENSDNNKMISARIEDMKYKLGDEFQNTIDEYESTRN